VRGSTEDERLLVSRFLTEGDHRAFEALVRMHLPSIRRFIASRLADRDEAEEAEQDLLVRLYSSLGSWKGESSFRTWLFRLCAIASADLIRRKVRERGRMRRFGLIRDTAEPRESDRADWALQRESEAGIVRRSLALLGEPGASLLYLRDAEGLGLDELSVIFGLPPGTVKSRLSRARVRLRAWLEAEGIAVPSRDSAAGGNLDRVGAASGEGWSGGEGGARHEG
jgi:RNA polymerase sigma-70 factor (ECF subfamily)